MPAYDDMTDLTNGNGSAEEDNSASTYGSEELVVTGPSPDLAAQWVQWALGRPTPVNPLLDDTGKFAKHGDVGDVTFLAGIAYEPGEAPDPPHFYAERDITVDYGDALVFPMINSFNLYNPALADDQKTPEEDVYDRTIEEFEALDSHYLRIKSGDEVIVEIQSDEVDDFAVTSDYFAVQMPVRNLYSDSLQPEHAKDWGGGIYNPALTMGYYAMVDGLEPGDYTVQFGGTASEFNFTLDIEYTVEVQEHGNDMLLM